MWSPLCCLRNAVKEFSRNGFYSKRQQIALPVRPSIHTIVSRPRFFKNVAHILTIANVVQIFVAKLGGVVVAGPAVKVDRQLVAVDGTDGRNADHARIAAVLSFKPHPNFNRRSASTEVPWW